MGGYVGVRGFPERDMLLLGAVGGEGLGRPDFVMRRRRRRRRRVRLLATIQQKTSKNPIPSRMVSKKITRFRAGYGSAQNFAGYFAALVKSFFEEFGYQTSRKN